MFLLFLIKMFATHLKPKRRAEQRVDRGHRQVFADRDGCWWGWHTAKQNIRLLVSQVEQTMSLCSPPTAAAAQEGRGLRALQAQLSSNPSDSQPSAPLSPLAPDHPGLPSLPPSYTEAVSTSSTPLYPCAPPKYSELPEGGSTAMIRWDLHSLPWWSHTKVHPRLRHYNVLLPDIHKNTAFMTRHNNKLFPIHQFFKDIVHLILMFQHDLYLELVCHPSVHPRGRHILEYAQMRSAIRPILLMSRQAGQIDETASMPQAYILKAGNSWMEKSADDFEFSAERLSENAKTFNSA